MSNVAESLAVIDGPANWLASDMADMKEWAIYLTQDQIQEIVAALDSAQSQGVDISGLTKQNFPLPSFGPLIADIQDRLENGRGIAVLRGFPALDFNKSDLRMIYWGLGLHMGTGMSQSPKGDLLGDVRDFGSNPWASGGRGYTSRVHLGFHADSADVVCLMVLRPAKEGGLSSICSSLAIRNEIARTRPDLLEELYKPMYWSWKGAEPKGGRPYYQQPIYSEHDGKFSSRYIKTHILTAEEDYPELPRITPLQHEAMAMIDTLAIDPRFHFSMMFEPGDMQFLNNHVTMHSRTEFQDFEEEDRKRHLLRMWLSMPNTRELSPLMAEFYGDVRPGAIRGGFPSQSGGYSYETVQARD